MIKKQTTKDGDGYVSQTNPNTLEQFKSKTSQRTQIWSPMVVAVKSYKKVTIFREGK